MWPLLPSQIPGSGPEVHLVDVPTLMIGLLVITVVMLGGFAFLFVRMARARREMRVVRCPSAGVRAVVIVQRGVAGVDGVAYCSRWSTGHASSCDYACLRHAA